MRRHLLPLLLTVAMAPARVAAAEEPVPSAAEIGSVQVYLSIDEALRRAFPEAAVFASRLLPAPAAAQPSMQASLGRGPGADSVAVHTASDAAGRMLGYAIVAEEIGKYRPITFLVAAGTDLRVTSVAILVYRESRGAEVRRPRFLRQYRGKDVDDPIRINRDIINITGATLSVRALNTGVRKVLLLLASAVGEPRPHD